MIFKRGNTPTLTTTPEKPVESPTPKWLPIAQAEIGVHETSGSKATPRIVEYDTATTLKATSDEVAWCSAFVNWVMKQAGFRGTSSAAARSWATWGMELKTPVYGCIVVFWRGSKDGGLGHVAFWMGDDGKDNVHCLGGNQGDKVCIASEPKSHILSYRWPKVT